MTKRYEVYQRGIRCSCCSWETLGIFDTRKKAKQFVGNDKTLIIVKEDYDE